MAGAQQTVTLSDGTTISVYASGLKVQLSPDGGTETRLYPDGTKVTLLPDGVTIKLRPDGMRIQRDTKTGQNIFSFQDGTMVSQEASGTTVEKRPDGSQLQKIMQPSGESILLKVAPDGSRVQTFQNGTIIYITASKEQFQQNPDGSVFQIQGGSLKQVEQGGIPNLQASKVNGEFADLPGLDSGSGEMDVTPAEIAQSSGSNMASSSTVASRSLQASEKSSSPQPSSSREGVPVGEPVESLQSRASKFGAVLRQGQGSTAVDSASANSRPGAQKSLGSHASSGGVSGETLSALEHRIKDLLKENTNLKETLRLVESQAENDLESHRIRAQQETSELLEELAEARDKASRAKELEDALFAASAKLESSAEEKGLELERLSLLVAQKDTEIEQLKKSSAKRQTELSQELQVAQEKVASLESQTESSAGSNEGEAAKLAALTAKLDAAERQTREARLEASSLRDQVDGLETELGQSRSKAEQQSETNELLVQAEKEIAQLQLQVEDLIYRGGTAAEKLVQMQQQRDEATAQRDASQEKLTALTKKMVEAVSDLTEKELELSDAYSQLSRLQEDVGLASSADRVPAALEAERARASVLEHELKSALLLCSALDEDEASVKVANAQLKRQLGASEGRVKSLEMDLQSTNSKLDAVQAKLDAALANDTTSAVSAKSGNPTGVGGLRLQLATAQRELEEHKQKIAELEALQSISAPMQALSMSQPKSATMPPAPRPSGGLGSLLGDIQSGAKLKKVGTAEKPKSPVPPASQSASIAELCQMKAKQRASKKTSKIDDLLSDVADLIAKQKNEEHSDGGP